MSSSDYIRWGGMSAVLGSLLGIVVAPLITSAYALSEGAPELSPAWEPALSNLLSPLFGFASPGSVYATYGRLYLLVFLGLLLGFLALRAQQRGRSGPLVEWGLRLSLIGVVLNLLGNLPDYWFGEGTWLEAVGFLIGTVLGYLSLVVGSTMLGIGLLRSGTTPTRVGAWLLALCLPGIILVTLIGFENIPSGPALWFCFAWLVLGSVLWLRRGSPAEQQPPRVR